MSTTSGAGVSDQRELVTDRLVLRQWRDADREPFATMNTDPEVMAVFPKLYDQAESDAAIERYRARWREDPPCFFAVALRDGPFIGMVGLNRPTHGAHFTPCVEIGWRLTRSAWGKGYATEAARACLTWGFDDLGLDEIVSYAQPRNARSHSVMVRIGMRRDSAGDFDHKALPDGHPSQHHWLYRLSRKDWKKS